MILKYISNLNAQGESEYKDKKYEKAILLFKEIIEINPSHLQAYSNLSLVYYKLGNYEESINAGYRVILGTNDKLLLASTYYNIAKSLESQGKWKSALEAFEDAKFNRQHSAYEKGIKRMKDKLL